MYNTESANLRNSHEIGMNNKRKLLNSLTTEDIMGKKHSSSTKLSYASQENILINYLAEFCPNALFEENGTFKIKFPMQEEHILDYLTYRYSFGLYLHYSYFTKELRRVMAVIIQRV